MALFKRKRHPFLRFLLVSWAILASLISAWFLLSDNNANTKAYLLLGKDRPLVTTPAFSPEASGQSFGPSRVILLGIDGLSWQFLEEGFRRNVLPHLQRLATEGSIGLLRSLYPGALDSPVIWTTIATGMPPDVHGITGFLNDRGYYFSTEERTSKAVWNILSDMGRSVGVIGPLYSYPAEEVNGSYISDRGFGIPLVYTESGPLRAKQTYPPEQLDRIKPLLASSGLDEMFQASGWNPRSKVGDQFFKIYLKLSRTQLMQMIRSRDEIYTKIAERFLAQEQPEFAYVYWMQIDSASHFYYFRTDKVLETYRNVDSLVERILALMDSQTLLILCSDHGFRRSSFSNLIFSRFRQVGDHDPDGVLILYGSHVPAGGRIVSPQVYDIAPTILEALGLPVPAQMPGKPLVKFFPDRRSAYPEGYSIERPSMAQTSDSSITDWENKELIERLKAVGYLQ